MFVCDLLLISMVTLLTTLLVWVIVVIPVSLWVVFMVTQSLLYCHVRENAAHFQWRIKHSVVHYGK